MGIAWTGEQYAGERDRGKGDNGHTQCGRRGGHNQYYKLVRVGTTTTSNSSTSGSPHNFQRFHWCATHTPPYRTGSGQIGPVMLYYEGFDVRPQAIGAPLPTPSVLAMILGVGFYWPPS